MTDEASEALEPLPGDPIRSSLRQHLNEVRARVSLDLYESLQREAAALRSAVSAGATPVGDG